MGAIVRRHGQALRGPGLLSRHLRFFQPREHRRHFRPSLLMILILNVRQQRRRIGPGIVVQGDGEVDQPTPL